MLDENVKRIVISLRTYIKDERLKLDNDLDWAETQNDISKIEYLNGMKHVFRAIQIWLKDKGL